MFLRQLRADPKTADSAKADRKNTKPAKRVRGPMDAWFAPKGKNTSLSLRPFRDLATMGVIPRPPPPPPSDLFEDRFAPRTLAEFAGNSEAVATLLRILREPYDRKVIVVQGAVGKSTLVRLATERFNVVTVDPELPAAHIIEYVKSTGRNAQVSLGEKVAEKIVVIDNVFRALGDGAGFSKLIEARCRVRVIAISEVPRKRYTTGTVHTVTLRKVGIDAARRYVARISREIQVDLPDKHVKFFVDKAGGDFRKMLHGFKLLSYNVHGQRTGADGTKKVSRADLLNVLRFSQADAWFSAFETVDAALAGRAGGTFEDLFIRCSGEGRAISDLFFSNLQNCGDLATMDRLMDCLCDGDVLRSHSRWDLYDQSTAVSAVGGVIATRDVKTRKVTANNCLNNLGVVRARNRAKLAGGNAMDAAYAQKHLLKVVDPTA